jgi:hypothetical protein
MPLSDARTHALFTLTLTLTHISCCNYSAEHRIQSQINPRWISGGLNGSGSEFSPNTSFYCFQFSFHQFCIFKFIPLPSMPRNLSTDRGYVEILVYTRVCHGMCVLAVR